MKILALAGLTVAVLCAPCGAALALDVPQEKPSEVHWQQGPTSAALGKDVATISVPTEYVFADAADTRRVMERLGNTVDNSEVGMIKPEGEDWFLIFEYKPEGYVKDDEKDKIDKDAILESYRAGTEEANKRRKSRGIPGIHVTGWFEEPHYDAATHNLVWALRAKDDEGGEIVNYNVRILGRQGYMSVTLVDEPAKMAVTKPKFQQILSSFSYVKGKTYAEWRPGDKVAQYGLVALVAGGAGAAAAKLGLFATLAKLLAKGGKAIVAAIVALGVFLKRLFTGARRAEG
jgi:uncharacterized membrane-anchored protein